MIEFLSGVTTALLAIGVLNRRTIWGYITEEWRYRRDSIRVWWAMRQEKK
jgi:hypothetical protein